jgi:hypothetical protein
VTDSNNATELFYTGSDGSDHSQSTHARVELDIDLAANQRIDICIDILADGAAGPEVEVSPVSAIPATPQTIWRLPKISTLPRVRLHLREITVNAQLLFGFALGIYLITQLTQLPAFPIYFFCDEAVNTVLASDFIRDGARNYDGVFFPTFFKNGGQYCLGTTVYLQAIPFMLFGKSIWITRGFFVLFSSLTAIFSAFILRDIFKNRYWWSTPLWLAAVPTWFLHARGAFEYASMVTFYAGFLYFYLRYRSDTPRMLYPALIFGAMTFYTYTPGQLIMVVSGMLLLISDWRYHLQHWRVAMRGTGLLILLVAPLVRFWMYMPAEYAQRLSMYGSYWAADIPTVEKIGQYLHIYLSGLNPLYWFFPHSYDTPLHTMKGYGHIHWFMLVPFLFGLWQALSKHKQASMRVLLAALLAAPAGTAMAMLHVNRVLTIVIPVIVLGLIGFSAGVDWLEQRKPVRREITTAAMMVVIVVFSLFMTADALMRGPTWYTNYGLSGMQWGARQVYAAAQAYIQLFPDRTLHISPNWTFQSEVVRDFFVPGESQIRIGTADRSIARVDSNLDQKAFVLMPDEYERVRASGRFEEPQVDKIISYPDGRAGFYFVRLTYLEGIEGIIQAELAARNQMIKAEIMIAGQNVIVQHTAVEGDINSLFDGNLDTLVKTKGINPMLVEVIFNEPVPLAGITARVGSEKVKITVEVMGTESPRVYSIEAGEMGPYKDVPLVFDQVEVVSKLRFTLLDVNEPETSIVHLWEINLDYAQ